MRHLDWALARVEELSAPDELRAQESVQALVDALLTLRGDSSRGVFGMTPSAVIMTAAERSALAERILAALVFARDAFQRAGDPISLLALHKVAVALDLPALRVEKRFPLRCDPLGEVSGLGGPWRSRIARLRRARDQSLPFRWQALGDSFADRFEDGEPVETWMGAPAPERLYEFALRYEQTTGNMFSREIAAVWSIADGISVDDTPYLRAVEHWSWEDDGGLAIGSGHNEQGSLVLEVSAATTNLASTTVIDRDDDGVVAQTFKDIGEVFDRLLPRRWFG